MNWQPISTVPKDGTVLLLSSPLRMPFLGWWDATSGRWAIFRSGRMELVPALVSKPASLGPAWWTEVTK